MTLAISICSYSFHQLLASGRQDMFRYIRDCKELGCTQLDPWMAHLEPIQAACSEVRKVPYPERAMSFLTSEEVGYLAAVRRAGDEVGLPFGCLAVDGAHMYERELSARAANRAVAYRWLDVAAILGCSQVRIDTGGTHEMPDEQFAIIVQGYKDVVARAAERKLTVIMENHWGASQIPANCVRVLNAVPGLGLLWDSFNFHPHRDIPARKSGREVLAPYAALSHIKTFAFDAQGDEPYEDIPHALACLKAANYHGTLGIESCPPEGQDEIEAVRKTIALLKKLS
jgi:hypothetical protein